MESAGKNLGGRAYLVGKLQERGWSRRQSVAIVNKVFEEIGLALRRGEYVEFPFGLRKAEKGRRWDAPLTVEHVADDEGSKLVDGETPLPWAPGWSRKADKRSVAYLWDRALRQEEKQAQGRPPVVNK
jgi:hypothetical protein